MKEGLIIGITLGMIAGAVLVQSNPKLQDCVEKSKDTIKKEIKKSMAK